MASPRSSPRQFREKLIDQRWRVSPVRLRLERRVLTNLGRRRDRPHGRILTYHSTGTPEWGVNDVTPTRFVEHVDLAFELGYHFVPLRTIVAGADGPRDLAITFDDGLRSVMAVSPYLLSLGIPFAVSVVSGWASNPGNRFMSWDELGRLRDAGVEIASHSVTHANFREIELDKRQAELADSRAAIERELGFEPEVFAIPFGRRRDWDDDCTRMARSAGYTAVLAQAERLKPAGAIGRSFVCSYDGRREFRAILEGRFDSWEEWF